MVASREVATPGSPTASGTPHLLANHGLRSPAWVTNGEKGAPAIGGRSHYHSIPPEVVFFPPSHQCRAPSQSSGHLHLPLLPPSANIGARDPKLTAVSILLFFYLIRGLARGAKGRILLSSISRAEISECRSEPAPIFSSYLYPNTNTSVQCSCHESAIRYNGSHTLNIAYVLSSFPHRHARLLPTVLLASSQSVRHARP